MGLDIYVGPLYRYYSGDWETVVQQLGREQGFEVTVVRPQPPLGGVAKWLRRLFRLPESSNPSPELVRDAVIKWRAALSSGLGSELGQPLYWDESETAPYFTDKPAWDGYGGVLLLAAHDEHPEVAHPTTVGEDWSQDEAWKLSEADENSRYRHLLRPELWLPGEFDSLLQVKDLGGRDVVAGSSLRLLAELQTLNQNTFEATDEQLQEWRCAGAEYGGPFELTARFGLAVMLDLTRQSVTHRLPMKLDY
jgi:hypothetical protein